MSILLMPKIQIVSLLSCLHPQSFISPFLPCQILLQSHESTLMCCMLSNLNKSLPIMRGKIFLTIGALRIFLYKLYYLILLHSSFLIYDSNILYLYSNSFGMRLSPNEFRIFQLKFIQSFNFLQKYGKKLSTFSLAIDPWRTLVSQAICAKELLISC